MEMKMYWHDAGHITNMAAMPIYGKNLQKSTSPAKISGEPLQDHWSSSLLFLLLSINCGYKLEPPQCGGSNVYQRSMFRVKIRKISHLSSENYNFYSREILKYIARTCLRNVKQF